MLSIAQPLVRMLSRLMLLATKTCLLKLALMMTFKQSSRLNLR
jgi:hypothetical protein